MTSLTSSLSGEHPPVKVLTTLSAIALAGEDVDLLEAVLSELRGLSLERRTYEDPTGLVELVLSSHALSEDNTNTALEILEGANLVHPNMAITRNRLAKTLLAAGRAEDALALLGTPDVRWDAEGSRLKGVARIEAGEEEGVREMQRAIKLRPWEERGWEGLAWGRKMIAEAEGE